MKILKRMSILVIITLFFRLLFFYDIWDDAKIKYVCIAISIINLLLLIRNGSFKKSKIKYILILSIIFTILVFSIKNELLAIGSFLVLFSLNLIILSSLLKNALNLNNIKNIELIIISLFTIFILVVNIIDFVKVISIQKKADNIVSVIENDIENAKNKQEILDTSVKIVGIPVSEIPEDNDMRKNKSVFLSDRLSFMYDVFINYFKRLYFDFYNYEEEIDSDKFTTIKEAFTNQEFIELFYNFENLYIMVIIISSLGNVLCIFSLIFSNKKQEER